VPEFRFDDFEWRSKLGSGSFGTVQLARSLRTSAEYAVKGSSVDCADAAAIDNERKVFAKLLANPHPHVVPVYGVCTDAADRCLRLVMRVCAHGGLDAALRASRAKVCP
jgi:hypothetical protein